MTDLVAKVRGFVEERILPAEAALTGGDAELLRSLQGQARDEGLWGIPLPVQLGGQGVPLSDYAPVAEAEGRSDAGPTVLGSDLLLDATMLDRHASPTVRDRFLRAMVAGACPPSFAMTEPGVAGTDPSALATTAVRDGDSWVVTGRKWFTSRAATAGFTTVVCRTEDGGFVLVVVPAGAPGSRIVREVPVLGAGGQYELAFDGVRVPADHAVGEPGDGLTVVGERLALGRTLRCLRWLGQTGRAFDLLCRRLLDRQVRGGALASQQLLHQYVFDSHADLAAARAATAAAVTAVDGHGGDPRVAVGTAKVVTARAFMAVVDRAVQVHGAEGLTDDTPLAMLFRTARAARILDGPDELHVTTVARRILAGYQPGAGSTPERTASNTPRK